MADTPEVYIGVDIGGTKVAAGLVDTQGKILYRTRNPMQARGSAADGLASVRAAIDKAFRENPGATIRGIGLISPGPVDPQTGTILNPANLPCWRGFPLAAQIQEAYKLPAHVHND